MIVGIDSCKGVNGFTQEQLGLMKAYLQGAVYCWCKNCKGQWFAARALIGGENYYWQGTPLMPLYLYYLNGDDRNNEYAIEEAGKAAGRLLKEVLHKDKRKFETREGFARQYRWTREEEEND